jgi:type 1 fimbria pilin
MKRLLFRSISARIAWLTLGLWLLFVPSAYATCTLQRMSNALLPAPTTLTLPRDTSMGTIVYDTGWESTGAGQVTCQGGEIWSMGIPVGLTPVSGMSRVYQSGVPGLGIKVAYSNGAYGLPSSLDNVDNNSTFILQSPIATVCNQGGWPGGTGCLIWSTTYSPNGWFRMQYIALGSQIQSGTSSLPSPIGQVLYGGQVVNQGSFNNTTFVIKVLTCTVSTPNITVNLPTVRVADFSASGSRVGAKSFNVPLVCDKGVTVSYQFDGSRPSGVAASNVLSNNAMGDNAAKGIGIALYRGDNTSSNALALGQKWLYITTTTDKQQVNIPVTSWYYQNGAAKPSGGLVSGAATITMYYQ